MFSLAEFTSRDGVGHADRASYYQLTACFEATLHPVGALEISLAAQILRSTWLGQKHAAIDEATLPDDAARAPHPTTALAEATRTSSGSARRVTRREDDARWKLMTRLAPSPPL